MSSCRRVLSVEDVPSNQQLVSLFLESDGYAVDQVQSGLDALAAVRDNQYDAILMDLRLPDLDGLEVVRRMRAMDAPGSRQVIVAVTAEVFPERLAAARAAGVDGHVTKPFTRASLRAALEAVTGALGETGMEPASLGLADRAQIYGRSASCSIADADGTTGSSKLRRAG